MFKTAFIKGMMKNIFFCVVFGISLSISLSAQEVEIDSTHIVGLSEVIVIGKSNLKHRKKVKPLATIDDYLEESGKVTMIKRGNYAWEVSLNSMLTERLSVTIDGMQIFGACTDKMDPITSYVDVSNLSEVTISSGQQGAENGATIGGGIDLKIQKNNFKKEEFNVGVDIGYETNSQARIISSEVNFANEKFFTNVDGIYRKSNNYSAGGNEEILYSQFEKFNVSGVAGIKTGKKGALIGAVIYDKATDVGYPALPMDVSLAEALIASMTFKIDSVNALINTWETKLYANNITHVMDDSKRPDVPIRMDMPGWSDTYGFYSKGYAEKENHNLLFNVNGYYNRSLAEMTMYPNDPSESSMFMLTWPDVRTIYTGIYGEDEISLTQTKKLKFSGRFGYQHEKLADEFGLQSLQIFYPDLKGTQNRYTYNLSTQYQIAYQKTSLLFAIGYGERAPSVSEAYGFYLFNSFDNYDYIGNPYLNNEKSFEFNGTLNYSLQKLKISAEGSYFFISDYIIGKTDPNLTPMTIGADGVRVYTALEYATIFNASLRANYRLFPNWNLEGFLGYALGKDHQQHNLPLISPFSYKAALQYKNNLFNAEINVNGAGEQRNFSSYFGENKTSDYAIININAAYIWYLNNHKIYIKAGVENLFDTYYSTYADWNNIPRMGRNFFMNISYNIK